MKSLFLTPYCPLPIDSGAKMEMWKHLKVLKALGKCTIVSARSKPVGSGWSENALAAVRELGFAVVLREACLHRSTKQRLGIGYAAICKALRLEKAFGQLNPYHRYAFPDHWWLPLTSEADIAVINYSYWARLGCKCPKIVVLHDLLSEVMWGGGKLERRELSSAALVIVISQSEEEILRRRGLKNVFWSPPSIDPVVLPDAARAGIVGSGNLFNREGLRWLEDAKFRGTQAVRVYGAIASFSEDARFELIGPYRDHWRPYRECGVLLLPFKLGTGVQIKSIEALAAGRAIIARQGAMRGLPEGEKAWIEAHSAEMMFSEAQRLCRDDQERRRWAQASSSYYATHLNSKRVFDSLKEIYTRCAMSQSTSNGAKASG